VAKTATSAADGTYSFIVSYGWSGTVTPSKIGYFFVPVSRTYANVLVNQVNQSYTATPITFIIYGNAGVAGATLSYTDGVAKTVTSASNGDYLLSVSYGWSGTVTPSKAGYGFNPVSITYTNVLANLYNQNYTITFSISGNTGVPGAVLR